jgi:hypothetical protein
MPSTVTCMPSASMRERTQSRPCLSSSVNASRQTPPPARAPIFPSSCNEASKRSPLMSTIVPFPGARESPGGR